MENDNDIEKQLIVDDENYSKERAKKIAEKIIKYGKITKKGEILILDNSLSPDDKLRLSLVLRFIAHIFNSEIPEAITLKELSLILSERLEAVGSRLSQIIKNENFARKFKKGVYVAQYFAIDKFLESLNKKGSVNDIHEKGRHKKTRKITNKTVTGVGKDILELLINKDFFKTPKTVKEACDMLKQETKFYDPRVVDATIRKTFVSSQKFLRRLPAEKKGKSRWVYVNAK
jgi:hypothetical protein